jgi:hypothetical protein
VPFGDAAFGAGDEFGDVVTVEPFAFGAGDNVGNGEDQLSVDDLS